MKKTLSALLLLPLVVAAFIACSGDDDTETGQTAKKTVTFTAAFDPQTRVTYIDGTNPETSKPQIKSRWDDSDLNGTVTFKDASDNEYEFTISSIGDGGLTATLTFDGDFPETFTGTATYEVEAAEAQVQAANGSLSENVADATAHLNAGTKLVSTLPGDINGTTIKFRHAETSLYRIAFTAPAAIQQGSKLIMKANAKTIGEVTLNFTVAEGTKLVAYMRGATQAATTKLTYTLIDGDDTYSYVKEMSSKDLVEGKYYYANLESEAIIHSKGVYEVFGDAPIDMQPVDFGVYLDDNENITDEANGTKKLLMGDRFLGASTPGAEDALYFYWGELEGHRVDSKGNLILNEGDAATFSYSNSDSKAGKATKLGKVNNLINVGIVRKDVLGISKDGYVLVDELDAVRYHLKGNWRMMSYKEAQAIKNMISVKANSNKDGIVYSKDGIELEFKFIGSIRDKKNLTSNINPKTSAGTYWKTVLIWSRDFCITGSAYCYGANQQSEGGDINFYYGDDNAGTTSTAYMYTGIPIIPCLVVPIKKTSE